jgi:hypothetical protein
MWNYIYIFSYIYEVLKRFVCHNFKVEIPDVYIFAGLFIWILLRVDPRKKESTDVTTVSESFVYLRNKSWKPECVGSFNMDWRILVFYPEPKFTNIRQSMLKLKTHFGFHDLVRFWYV